MAEGHARHAQAVAQLRADPGLPPEEELPAESTLVTAESSDRAACSPAWSRCRRGGSSRAEEADRDLPDLALAPALAQDRPPSTGSAF